MMRVLCVLAVSLLLGVVGASLLQADSGDDSRSASDSSLVIYGAVDESAIRPLLEAFAQRRPGIAVDYREFNSLTLYRYFLEHPEERPDLMLSPAMHLQLKLVNDGYALRYRSEQFDRIPQRFRWRDELFGYALDPVVIAINTDILAGDPLPQSRDQLLELIRRKGHLLDEKIGLLDIESTGLGYLAWSYDSQLSRTYERLLEAFGIHHSRLYESNEAMLRALTRGEIFIAYNALGSYSQALPAQHSWIVPVLPTDYTTVVVRTAFIPKSARNPVSAQVFLDFLLSGQGQQVLASDSALIPIGTGVGSEGTILQSAHSLLKPIPLGLELLLQSDDAKRQLLFDEWHSAMPHLDK